MFCAQSDYEKALEYYVKALLIRRRVLGSEHPDTATTFSNMSGVLHEYVDLRKAHVIVEKVLDPDYP